MQESILSHVQRIVKGEVSLAMKEQQAVVTSSIMQAMRSAAGTPVPSTHLDYQTQQANILQLLQQGQINQAFQQVSANMDTQNQHKNKTKKGKYAAMGEKVLSASQCWINPTLEAQSIEGQPAAAMCYWSTFAKESTTRSGATCRE